MTRPQGSSHHRRPCPVSRTSSTLRRPPPPTSFHAPFFSPHDGFPVHPNRPAVGRDTTTTRTSGRTYFG